MMRTVAIIFVCTSLAACTMPTHLVHPTKPVTEQYRDEVECKALAQQAAGDGFGFVHEAMKSDLLIKCYYGRGYVKAPS